MKDCQDAFGHEMYDHLQNQGGFEIVERDDGLFSISVGPQMYFSEYRDWPSIEQKAIKLAKGRVLDIGCGAGRQELSQELQTHIRQAILFIWSITSSTARGARCQGRRGSVYDTKNT
jgi:SAM-dependent methyltransferase